MIQLWKRRCVNCHRAWCATAKALVGNRNCPFCGSRKTWAPDLEK